ncbi:hypothetical protein BCR39DRAFT_559263 [Naematelia encephala]|uniref:SRPBCC domain-containing protein n=1 Tax=Naematelia encephala TaxID=71784 RepID=A0A1Y2B2B5_9TREE|nr:hypothetical protein BCR39DRAFT_559263 [Naematelia encephala]
MPITSEIIIDAPPQVVRQVLLDFPTLRDWHDGAHFEFIEVLAPGRKSGIETVKGDRVKVKVPWWPLPFYSTVQENKPNRFVWAAGSSLLLLGRHEYTLNPDASGNPNRTLFSQSEGFVGLLSYFIDSPTSMAGKKTLQGFEGFDRDLKAGVERIWQERHGK